MTAIERPAIFVSHEVVVVSAVDPCAAVEIARGSGPAIRSWSDRGFRCFVLLPDGGGSQLGRSRVERSLAEALADVGARFDRACWYPAGGGDRAVVAILTTAVENRIDVRRSLLVGTVPALLVAGRAAGLAAVAVGPGGGADVADLVCEDLAGVAELWRAQSALERGVT